VRDDARSYAVVHAGVVPEGKDDQFFVDVGNFLTVDEYNEKRLRERDVSSLYDPAAGYGWAWDTDGNRELYKDQRVTSDNAYNARKFVVAAIIVNHVISAINAARTAIAHNRALEESQQGLQIKAGVLGTLDAPHGLLLTVSHPF
jgi:hypothetical protein